MFSIEGFIGSLISGCVCNLKGRVWALKIISFLHLISYLLAFSYMPIIIIISRFVIGITARASYIAIPLFVSEIAEVLWVFYHTRDFFYEILSFTAIVTHWGQSWYWLKLLGWYLATYADHFWRLFMFSWIYIWFAMFFLLSAKMLLETPYHLISRGKIKVNNLFSSKKRNAKKLSNISRYLRAY